MILRFYDVTYDLQYVQKIWLNYFYLHLKFQDGSEEVIDLREYECDPKELMDQISCNKNKEGYKYIRKKTGLNKGNPQQ
jgi:hypothetical protein